MSVTCRTMTSADVDAVCALAHKIWHRHYPGIITVEQIDYMLGQRYRPERLREELATPGIAWDVAERDGALCGFASTHHDRVHGELKLDKLYVDPAVQRHGIGRRLFEQAIERARSLACSALYLAVNKHNGQAIEAYRRYGFAVRDAVTVDIGGGFVMDDFIMARSL